MGNPLYSPVNRGAEALTISMGTTGESQNKFPLSHLVDRKAGTLWRRAGSGSFSIYFDFGVNISIDTLGLINHNIQPGASVKLLGASGGYEELVDISELLSHDKLFVKFTRGSWNYFAFQVQNVLQADPPSIGQLWLGDGYELSRNVAWGIEQGVEYRSSDLTAHTGATSSYHISENEYFEGDMPSLTTEEKEEIALLYQRVKGRAGRFLFAPESDDPRAYIGRLEESRFGARNTSVNRFNGMSLRVVEDPWGRPAI